MGEGGCMVGRGEGVGGRVVLTFFLSWLTCKGHGVLLFFALLGGICLYPPFKSCILLSQRLHLISVALLKVNEVLLHFSLPFQDGCQVQLVCHNLHGDTSSATC